MSWRPALAGVALALAFAVPVRAAAGNALVANQLPSVSLARLDLGALPDAGTRSGLEIYQSFREGLADPDCAAAATRTRWTRHFDHAPDQLSRPDDDLLPLFGYVVDALRDAQLPTEFALIPFVESGYKPGARSPSGPAGLWQFIGVTARNHGIQVEGGYDGRLSPVDSTQAAVRYLKTLHGMFGGDWRLAVMAYNAGEYRILQSMRRAGMNAGNARPAELPGLAPITYAYVEKLHALACVLEAEGDDAWLRKLDRPVPRLAAHTLPAGTRNLKDWAQRTGVDAEQLRRLNPAAVHLAASRKPPRILAPSTLLEPGSAPQFVARRARTVAGTGADAAPVDTPLAQAAAAGPGPATGAVGVAEAAGSAIAATPELHTVRRGESPWTIARRYGMQPAQLLRRNQLPGNAVLQPGMVLRLREAEE